MSTRLTIAMLLDDSIIVANAIGGDGIIALPKRSGCKTMPSVQALALHDNALKLAEFGYRSSLFPRRNIRIVGVMKALTEAHYFAAGSA